ncbi:MAG: L-glutamate gamma-semialdehyde dehydrogenase, partial [Anaerolineales bacterium]|nr:L-glutamate gamma-semialdehyde dehydrogenase [Anaerolineales bacterium]
MTSDFQLTYSTMFDPPEELHIRFEGALQVKRASLGREYGMLIGGKEVFADHAFQVKNPARKNQVLASFPTGTPGHADQAVA